MFKFLRRLKSNRFRIDKTIKFGKCLVNGFPCDRFLYGRGCHRGTRCGSNMYPASTWVFIATFPSKEVCSSAYSRIWASKEMIVESPKDKYVFNLKNNFFGCWGHKEIDTISGSSVNECYEHLVTKV